MKYILCVLTCLLFYSGYSQTQIEKFYDEKGIPISKAKFQNSINHAVNIDYYYGNDSIIIRRLYNRIKYDKLSDDNHKILRDYLEDISGRKSDFSKIIIINYFPGETRIEEGKSHATIYQNKYLKHIRKSGDIQQYWIYKSAENLANQHSDTLNWLHDKRGLIERAFFPI
ncbi:MAG: hypothetical protein ACO1N9_01950 [Flavobacterium sp.]